MPMMGAGNNCTAANTAAEIVMAMPMPTPRLFFARSYMPAPIF